MKKSKFNKVCSLMLCLLLTIQAASLLSLSAGAVSQADYEQKQYYKNSSSPMNGEYTAVQTSAGEAGNPVSNYTIKLDGEWKMTDKGKISDLAAGKGWDSAIKAKVPGSIHTALFEAGVIDDPYVGDNMKTANKYGQKSWYLQRTFTYEGSGKNVQLRFDGVCNVADFYLNGTKICSHEGMFGGPYIDVTDQIKKGENTLIVHLKPAKDYTQTVVFNCSYGWHYAKLYPLGIWQSVSIADLPSVQLDHPFVTTVDYLKGTVDLAIKLDSDNSADIKGKLTVSFIPKNFNGTPSYFTADVQCKNGDTLRFRTDIPDTHLWWPNGYGAQDLYVLNTVFASADGSFDETSSEFGIRQLDYAPFPSGEKNSSYNRQFVINGVKVFMKGAGWCTIDAMMRFTREDYDRILSRAKDEGVNYLRSWGGGLVETEEFYDLCDEYGICVYQEWPCCWDSTKTQPADILYETVIYGCKRLRNRPSLVVWGGGNEGNAPYNDKVLNNIGKLTYETDGTRDFWRQDGGTGGTNIVHDHIWWSGASPEHYIKTYTSSQEMNMSEYGLGAMMNRQSIQKFATEKELAEWPISNKNTISYHTATFNGFYGWNPTPYGYDIDAHMHYASFFTDVDSLDELILGSQLSQAQSDYPLAINSRIKAPSSTVNVIYKLNDCYPGASWSVVDWYGAPKIAHYLMQDAYRPVMAAFLADRYNVVNNDSLTLPIYILDDTVSLKGKDTKVSVTAYDENLAVIKTEMYGGAVASSVNKVGEFSLSAEQVVHCPMIVTADLIVGGEFYNRTYMYYNYEYDSSCLFYLPRTTVEYTVTGNTVKIKNTGSVPAIGLHLNSSAEDKFVCSDGYFILTPGQSADITVNDISLFTGIDGFNMADASDKTPPTAPANVKADDVKCDSVKISWDKSEDNLGLFAYYVTLTDDNGQKTTELVHRNKTEAVISGLSELTGYSVTVYAADNNSNRSEESTAVKFKTEPDKSTPTVLSADINESGEIKVTFNTEMNKILLSDTSRYILNHGAEITSAKPSDDGKSVVLTVANIDNTAAYELGVIGLADTKKTANSTGYQQLSVTRSLYIKVDFEPDDKGDVYTAGKYVLPVNGVNGDPSYVPNGESGKALSIASGFGAMVENIDFAFPENSSIVISINGKASNGFNLLLAKGPKESGHFEFYTRDGYLWIYAPDIGDIDLHYNVNNKSGWHTLAFVRENGKLSVYDDGEAVSSVEFKGTIAKKKDTVSFGVLNDGSLPFAGIIDSVRFYEAALTAAELIKPAGDGSPEFSISENLTGKKDKTDFSFPKGTAINIWFNKTNAESDFAILFAKSTKASDKHFEVYTERGALCIYTPSGVNALQLNTNLNNYLGSWHMLTLVHQDASIEVYIDSALVSSVSAELAIPDGSDTCYYGRLVEGGFDFPGTIGECTFIDHAPDAKEISELYTSKLIVTEKDGVDFESHQIDMIVGEEAPCVIKASEGAKYSLSLSGDSAVLDGQTIKAVKSGQTIIYARTEGGTFISAMLVTVKDHEDIQTEPVTTEQTEPDETDVKTEEVIATDHVGTEKNKTNPLIPIVIITASALAVAAAIIVIITKKKKNRSVK